MKKVYIVILNYKGHKDTIELLSSLQRIKKHHFNPSVVVVDNFPQDPIRIEGKDFKNLNLKVIYNNKNLGFSGGNNVGIKYSLGNGADYVLLINNDTYVDEEFVEELLKVFENESSVGIVVPKIYFAKGFEFHKKYKESELGKVVWFAGGNIDWKNVIGYHTGVDEVDHGQFNEERDTEIASGCCLMLKRELLEKIKGYDDRYFLYYEDADLSMRTVRQGYRIVFAPRSIIWHKNAQSSGGSGSSLQDYYISRNRLIFGFKYAKLRARGALFKESIRLILSGRTWQRKGIVDFYINRLGKGSFN
jgi:GT2 family glycosyltransferase